MKVPFVDLKAQFKSIETEVRAAFEDLMEKTDFISGPAARKFEKEFANYIGTKFCLACGNGTDALEMAMQAMGIGAGDEVIVPALSWISTAETVSSVGATPVFVDVNEHFCIDTNLIEAKITPKTKGIIPVHLYGNPADMTEIMAIAKKHRLRVLEDCAQSHGAELNGKRCGTFGDVATYSFYPGKNLGAYGDAGALVTDSPEIERMTRLLANHGQEVRHTHLIEGRNSRLDGFQARILSIKLKYIEKWTEARIANANYYTSRFDQSLVTSPVVEAGKRHVFHLYVIQCEDRDGLIKHLASHDISASLHYPTPMPLMPAYKRFGHVAADFPVAKKLCDNIVSLPLYPELTHEMMDFVVEKTHEFLS